MRWDPTGEEVCPAEERAVPGGETRIVKKECGDLWLGVSRDSPCGLGPARGSAMGTVGGGRGVPREIAYLWCGVYLQVEGKGGPLHRADLFTLPPLGPCEPEARPG